ncbi:MAG: amidohydrolase [Anaerolineae bacterium]|nr:amidohydrolase [Anaerolineae bacterium]
MADPQVDLQPDRVLFNGAIYTMDPRLPRASALAVVGGRIAALGSDDLKAAAGPGTDRVDLEGRCVLPGLTDAHIHYTWFARGLQDVNLGDTTTLEDAMARVAQRAHTTPPGEWIRGRGWDQEVWANRRFPTAADLDRASSTHPIALVAKSGHALAANSLALAQARVTADRPDPAGGRIVRDATGQPTGLLLEDAMDLVLEAIPEPDVETIAAAVEGAFERAWRVGLTAIHDVDRLDAFDAYQRLHARGTLGLRVVKYLPSDILNAALALRLRTGLGDDWLRIGGIKAFADGALGPRTAAMLEPFVGEPGNLGMMTLSQAELDHLVRRASGGGLALAVHAIGDRANRAVLDALSTAQPSTPPLRHRIEHAQIVHPDDVGRFAALGVVASMQPIHATQDARMVDRYWGERGANAYAWRSLLNAGAVLAFGSDCPVEDMNPFLGIHAAVTRARSDGYGGPDGWRPEQRLSVTEAVWGFTQGAAYAGGMEQAIGSLSAGKWADLAVLDRDIFTCDPAAIAETQVLGTMIAGEWVFRT